MHHLMRPLPAFKLRMELVVPYSTLLFLNGGVVDKAHWLSSLFYHAWTDDTTHNMEIAVRPEHFETFLRVFDPLALRLEKELGECGTYFTGRFVGRSTKAVLAPNYERDVLFLDVHVSRRAAGRDFLAQLEDQLMEAIPIRPHWGKEFSMGHAQLEQLYPAECWQTFQAMRLRYDPDNLFVNGFTDRVFGCSHSPQSEPAGGETP